MVDWTRLQSYKKTKQKSFEQLCFQVAVKMFADQGTFTAIDDSGGGDGVEFYLTLRNRAQFGWQAKYYEGVVRLNVSNRKQKITDSLKRALEVHPNLCRWYLCLPMDLTVEERSWFDAELLKHIPKNKTVKIELWDESTLHELLNRPQLSGLKQAFFNSLELSEEWFKQKFESLFAVVKNKFDDLLYVPNTEFEYWYVHPLLCDRKFREERINYYPQKLQELYERAVKKLQDFRYVNGVWQPLFEEYIKRFTVFNEFFSSVLPAVHTRFENITPNGITYLSNKDFNAALLTLREIKEGVDEFRRVWYQENIHGKPTDVTDRHTQLNRVRTLEDIYQEILDELMYYISHSSIPVNHQIAHFLGNGGDGKTNLCVGLAKQYLNLNWPAIFIPCIKLTGQNPLSEQLLSLLDVKTGYSFSDFLDCLNELGKINNVRVPVILDGLNEALNVNGFWNEKLSQDLPSLETEISRRDNLVLITTCRTSYRRLVWGPVHPEDKRFHSLNGFTDHEDKKKLVRTYFTHYKIQADLSFLSLERFTKPLYLKIFCEATNPGKQQVKQVTLGFDSIYSIFDNFIRICNQNVYNRIIKAGKWPPLASTKNVASRVLHTLSKEIWLHPTRGLRLEEVMLMADSAIPSDYNYSITKALLDEELLFIRDSIDGEEYVYLTYDLMAGYFIAKYLLSEKTDFATFFTSTEEMAPLINESDHRLHPNNEDILDGLCSLLPIQYGIFVHDLLDKSTQKSFFHQKLLNKSISATLLLSPEYIPNEQVIYIEKLAGKSQNLIRLIELSDDVFFISNHPFNFSFWSRLLNTLPMNDRDLRWSEYLRNLKENFLEDVINEFTYLQEFQTLTNEQKEKIDLVAQFLFWTFTSTSTSLKERTAKALYLFGVKFPSNFFKHYYVSAGINDPSVFEWCNVVLYNVVLFIMKTATTNYRSELVAIATFLITEVLSEKGKYKTNHLTTRNYAFATFKLLSRKLTEVDKLGTLDNIEKNFKKFGVIHWQEAEDLNAEEYRDGNALVDYFFNKEKMPYVMVGNGNEYNRTPEFQSTQAKLRWRAYQLGYQFELFGEIDKDIARFRNYGEAFQKTERYADKYIEIAFLEYCGYLAGCKKLRSYDDIGHLRTFEPKVDPTEKVHDNRTALIRKPIVTASYIDTETTLPEWGSNTSLPDVTEYLVRSDFGGDDINFVLLRALVRQHNKAFERQIFFQIDTVFVKNKALRQARKAFAKAATRLGWANDSIPSTIHIHESEIPDADMIPYNKFIKWYYSISSRQVERDYTRIALIKDGVEMSEEEADEIWNKMVTSLKYISYPRENLSGFPLTRVRFSSSPDDEESLEGAFKTMGIELREVSLKKKEQKEIDRQLAVFIPVRELKGGIYLCKNIIDYFHLSSPIGSTDLLDEEGNLASLYTGHRVEYVDQEAFTYLRKDLLDKYLQDNDLTMFTIVWGERDYYPPDGDWMIRTKNLEERKWSQFYESIEYQI